MGIFENFDATMWTLFALLAAAVLGYYFWPESTRAAAEVSVDEATRKQAKPLIALASDQADRQLFQLSQMPLRITATETLRSRLASGDLPGAAELTEALWAQQRAMITRLEGELDYAQQADVSGHFAIAAPANQPGALLKKTLNELESLYGQLAGLLHIPKGQKLWYGRAMVLMLSNRKLFDHVAWLTNVGLAASAPGAFTLSQDDVVMITIYATRVEMGLLEGNDQSASAGIVTAQGLTGEQLSSRPAAFIRPLVHEVCRAAVRGVGGENTPPWVEYGLAQWLCTKMLGKPLLLSGEQPPTWSEQCKAVIDSGAWARAADDSGKLEQLVSAAGLLLDQIMSRQSDRLLKELAQARTKTPSDELFGWACELFPASPATA